MKEGSNLLSKPGCVNCLHACCRDINIILNDEEADMVQFGRYDTEENPIDRTNEVRITDLQFLGRPETGRDTRAAYKMRGSCGHVTEVTDSRTGITFMGCGLHETSDQPLVCDKAFPEGGYGCMKRREYFFKDFLEEREGD